MNDTLNNSSYADYLKHQLDLISSGLSVKMYKRASDEEWGGFERGKDVRIQIQFNKNSLFEFVVEKSFWLQRNTNKEDRRYMRMWADQKIILLKKARIKKKAVKKPVVKKSVVKKKISTKMGYTQDNFEKMKKK